MKRALALLLLAYVAAVLIVAFVRLADPDPMPFAVEDESGSVYLWPGAMAEEPAPPEMRVTPCVIDPQTLPIRQPENRT